jgi:hypothetical protein
VAVDARACTEPCALTAALRQLRAAGIAGADLQWVGLPAASDVVLHERAQRIWLLTPSQASARDVEFDPDSVPQVDTRHPLPVLVARLAQRLHARARVQNLSLLAARSASDPIQAAFHSHLRWRVKDAPPVPTCQRAGQALDATAVPTVRHGDRLVVSLVNQGAAPLDITVLYLSADDVINKVFPTQRGDVNRLEPGEACDVPFTVYPPAIGAERIWVVGAQVRRHGERVDFGFLAQDASSQRSATGDTLADELVALADAAFAPDFSGFAMPTP